MISEDLLMHMQDPLRKGPGYLPQTDIVLMRSGMQALPAIDTHTVTMLTPRDLAEKSPQVTVK